MREDSGLEPAPYQWAAAGYMGAITSGRTLCGILFGGTVYLGYLNGRDATESPQITNEKRIHAIQSVGRLFNGFIERFHHTDCQALTGCDWSQKEDINRYFKDKAYQDTCYRQFEYVIEQCLYEKENVDGR